LAIQPRAYFHRRQVNQAHGGGGQALTWLHDNVEMTCQHPAAHVIAYLENVDTYTSNRSPGIREAQRQNHPLIVGLKGGQRVVPFKRRRIAGR